MSQDGPAGNGQQSAALPPWLDVLGGSTVPVLVLLAILAVGLLALAARSGLFGGGINFDELTISESYETFETPDLKWRIAYERGGQSTFAGTVRHVGAIRDRTLRIVTHDILVTTGDYADPKIVSTNVTEHMFTWGSRKTANPKGRINLLHTVPASKEVYRRLCAVRRGDKVSISGEEILEVKAYDREGKFRGEWKDMGCNTLLVRSVEPLDEG